MQREAHEKEEREPTESQKHEWNPTSNQDSETSPKNYQKHTKMEPEMVPKRSKGNTKHQKITENQVPHSGSPQNSKMTKQITPQLLQNEFGT